MSDINDKSTENELNPEPETQEITTENKAKNSEETRKPFADGVEWISSLVYAVLVMLALNLFVFRSITVDGDSMNNTLENGDKLIITNVCYTPQHGDIVVVEADRIQKHTTGADNGLYGEAIIKRVIGVAGDVIKFDFENGIVYRNGEALQEDYIAALTTLSEDRVGGVEYTVPENCVFVMGDNRNRSLDSRSNQVGFVDTDLIMGKALFRMFPLNEITGL